MSHLDTPGDRHVPRFQRRPAFVVGLILLVPLASIALLLVLHEFRWIDLPEPGENCTHAITTDWDGIVGWPMSFFALAYCAAILIVWVMSKGRIPPSFRYVARAGAVLSVVGLAMGLFGERLCLYWSLLLAANLALWIVTELAPGRDMLSRLAPEHRVSSLRVAVTLAAVISLVLALLNVAQTEQAQRLAARKLQQQTKTQPNPGGEVSADRLPPAPAAPETQTTPASAIPPSQELQTANAGAKRARPYVLGGKQAPVQAVMFVDYQCKHSAEAARKVQQLYDRYPGSLAVSIRHYPRCTDCNYSQQANLHPNACQAAKAAEAAGELKGDAGFWQMHAWLFERQGAFTPEQLKSALRQFGYEDPDKFLATMESKTTLRSVLSDIVDAESRSIRDTPLLLINGVQRDEEELSKLLTAVARSDAAANKDSHAKSTDWLPPLGSQNEISTEFSKELQASAIVATVRIVTDARGSVGRPR